MRIISFRTLREHWERENRNDSEQPLKTWYHHAKRAKWRNSADIKNDFKKASIITSDRVVFDIAGNKYRLIVKINYQKQLIFIRFIGTHREYDEIDVRVI